MVRYRHIMAVLKKHIKPPAWVLDMAPFTAGSPPGGHRPATNLVITPEAEEMLRNTLSELRMDSAQMETVVDAVLA